MHNKPVWDLAEAHVQSVDAVEGVAEQGLFGLEAVHCGGAEGHKQGLGEGLSGGRAGGVPGQRKDLETSLHQDRRAAAILQLKGFGRLHHTHKAPLWKSKKTKTLQHLSDFEKVLQQSRKQFF